MRETMTTAAIANVTVRPTISYDNPANDAEIPPVSVCAPPSRPCAPA